VWGIGGETSSKSQLRRGEDFNLGVLQLRREGRLLAQGEGGGGTSAMGDIPLPPALRQHSLLK